MDSTDACLSSVAFSRWERWSGRYRPTLDFDVPSDFGLFGIYLLATSQVDDRAYSMEKLYLDPGVVYIGKSFHVNRRTEASHRAVRAYRKRENDARCVNLRLSTWYTECNNMEADKKRLLVKKAELAMYERALLFEYAKLHGRLPKYNRE